jgi:hypothetical protein
LREEIKSSINLSNIEQIVLGSIIQRIGFESSSSELFSAA